MKRIVLTGGGTAGHVTPNLALIPRLQQEGFEVHYIGTQNGMEKDLIAEVPDVTYHGVRSGKFRRYFSWKNFTDPFKVIQGYFDSKKILKDLQPVAVFSKGGFVTVPVVIAGKRQKIPIVLHESDYTPGLANRIAITFASKVLVTFEDTLPHTKSKGVFTGTPIRPELYDGDREKGLTFCGFDGSKPILLCMGGSQGAQAINQALRNNLDTLLETFDIVHLCGAGKTDPQYLDKPGYLQFEYVGAELPDIFAAISIAVSRAGANSVFEFLALAIPALLIPLPRSASRGDQIQNASYFQRKGFAAVLDQEAITDQTLLDAIINLYEQRDEYSTKMKNTENADGTNAVLRELYATIDQAAEKHRKK